MATDMPSNQYQGEPPITLAFGMDRVMVELRSWATNDTVAEVLKRNGMLTTKRVAVLREFIGVLSAALDAFEDTVRDNRPPMIGLPTTITPDPCG